MASMSVNNFHVSNFEHVSISDLREWLFHYNMGSGSGVTNSSGVRSGVGAGVGAGVDLLFGSDFRSGFFFVYICFCIAKNSVFVPLWTERQNHTECTCGL
jgi:hypothetical protein